MRFADELVDATTLDHPPLRGKPDARLRNMAEQLVEGLSGSFQPGRYRDTYRDRVLDLVRRKAKGEEIDTERAQAPAPSDDLMAALEASLKGSKR
jgi:DNA end-binding protein Ku